MFPHLFLIDSILFSLSQGTGLGLSLCKTLIDLMGGTITLDDNYYSGVAGCPGTRFVIDLRTQPIEVDHVDPQLVDDSNAIDKKETKSSSSAVDTLPKALNVLVTDDDRVLRKLIRRSLVRIAPDWQISEASNGETAIAMAEEEGFDLILMDQYMASIEKQLLGTEACRVLRDKGIDAIVCGLSANDKEEAFLLAGADGFMLKPVPVDKNAFAEQLLQILSNGNRRLSRKQFSESTMETSMSTVETSMSSTNDECSSLNRYIYL